MFQVFGWIGGVVLVLTYLAMSRGYLDSKSRPYHLLNILGSAGIGISGWDVGNYPTVGLQIAWCLIALYAIVTLRKR